MVCGTGLSIEEVCKLIELKMGASSDVYLQSILPTTGENGEVGFSLILNNGEPVGDFLLSPQDVFDLICHPSFNIGVLSDKLGLPGIQNTLGGLQSQLDALSDENTTYTIGGATLGPDGYTFELVDSDGDIQTTNPIPVPDPETDGVHVDGATQPVVDAAAGTITFATLNDADESAGPPLVIDISSIIALAASMTPTSPNGSITIVGNPQSGYTIETDDQDTICTFALNGDGDLVKTRQFTVNGVPVGDPVETVIELGNSIVDNGDGTVDVTINGQTCKLSAKHRTRCRIVGTNAQGGQGLEETYTDFKSGTTEVEVLSYAPRGEIRSLNVVPGDIEIDNTTPLVGNTIYTAPFNFTFNCPTRVPLMLHTFHLRKFNFSGFGNMDIEIENLTTGDVKPIGGIIAYGQQGLHTDGSGHDDEDNNSGVQFYDVVEGQNDFELRVILDDPTAFINQGFMTLNQINVSAYTNVRICKD